MTSEQKAVARAEAALATAKLNLAKLNTKTAAARVMKAQERLAAAHKAAAKVTRNGMGVPVLAKAEKPAHVVHLTRYDEGGWHWERKARNGETVGEAHRSWPRRRDAERNLEQVNAKPYRLLIHE